MLYEVITPERLKAVLHVIYLIFNEGYQASHSEGLMREELSGRKDDVRSIGDGPSPRVVDESLQVRSWHRKPDA